MKKIFLAFILALFALSYSTSPTLAASSKAKLLTDTSSSANTVPFINAGPAEDSTAATALGIQVGGTEMMRVTATGSVGIGTTSPGARLDIAGAINLSSAANGGPSQYWFGRGGAYGGGTTAMYAPSGSGLEFGIANNVKMVMDTNGNVGIGTASTGAKLYVTSDNTGHTIHGYQTGSMAAIVGQASTTAYGWAGYFTVNGGGTCALSNNQTSWSCASDRRLKKNIFTIDNALDKIMKIDGVYFQWKKQMGEKRETGVIAQNVINVFPEVVSKNNKNGYYSVEYTGLLPPLIEAVKELKTENDALRASDKDLRARLEKLEERVK